jgi:hypothetical protein
MRGDIAPNVCAVVARSERDEAIHGLLDGSLEPVIGRAFARAACSQ